MAADDDLAMMLPEPPPPRPDRRATALAEAMRRFDGADAPASGAPQRPAPAAKRPAWAAIGRGRMGMLASVALVAVIAIPIALHSPDRSVPPAQQKAPMAAADGAVAPLAHSSSASPTHSPGADVVPGSASNGPAPKGEPRAADRTAASDGEVAAMPVPAPMPVSPALVAAPSAEPQGKAERADAEPLPPAQVQAARAVVVARAEEADRRARAAPAPPPAAMASNAVEPDNEAGNIVVTGARREASALYRRGDWNACTVNDPAQSLDRCKWLAASAAKGGRGKADAQLAAGLSLAWNGDMEGAITAFDQAIALRSHFALAYLNRGIAYQRSGDLDHALLDLDRAIRYAPRTARAYLYRSQILREMGETRRADADAARAIRLDLRYQALLE